MGMGSMALTEVRGPLLEGAAIVAKERQRKRVVGSRLRKLIFRLVRRPKLESEQKSMNILIIVISRFLCSFHRCVMSL